MQEIKITDNSNGKLFRDAFNELKPRSGSFKAGETVEVKYGNTVVGFAEVMAITQVKFCNISETLSFTTCGKAAYLLGAQLKKTSPERIFPDDVFENIVLQWVEVNGEWFEAEAKAWYDGFLGKIRRTGGAEIPAVRKETVSHGGHGETEAQDDEDITAMAD